MVLANAPLEVLLVDDDEPFRLALAKALRRKGHRVDTVGDAREAVLLLERGETSEGQRADVVVLDLRMPELDGLEVLRRTIGRRIPVVVLTGHGTVPDAVEAMRLGAHTFLMKPVDADGLEPVLRQAAEGLGRATDELIGHSEAMQRLRAVLERLAQADEHVLLTGETGTGKEVAARALHRGSRHAAFPFVPINMACLPRDLVESELFGHSRGAFTGATGRKVGLLEEAGEGTVFLDEIAELPLEHQPKLLRMLETRHYRPVGETRERPFSARLVAATHRSLFEEVRAGRFREDLFYRLQVLPLELPPLRARPEDVLPIFDHWTTVLSGRPIRLDDGAIEVLRGHPWPGNVRELVNLARRLVLFATDGQANAELLRRMLDANPFGARLAAAPPADVAALTTEDDPENEVTLDDLERRYIERLLARHRNVTRVAEILGINRRTLQRKLRGYGLDFGPV
jgi:DNA-binding NtrC family response regulator